MVSRIIILLLICMSLGFTQSVQDIVIEQVTTTDEGEFFFPGFTPDGRELIFTKANYTGLYIMNMSDAEIRELNNLPGAGYHPVFSEDGERIYYHTNTNIKGRRHMSLEMQNLQTLERVTIEENARHQVLPKSVSASKMTYQKNDKLYTFNTSDMKSTTFEINEPEPQISIENGELVLYRNGTKAKFKPLGDGHYLWPSLSPAKNKLLFTKSGEGTYISDLEGNIEVSFGYANAPEWSPDGKWIAYMDDKDDGHQYISSEIYITPIDGKNRFRITEGKSIDMFPVWSPDGKKLVFHTDKGEIFLAHLTFEGDGQ